MTDAERRDWLAWHRDYDDPTSSLARRLRVVQQELAQEIRGWFADAGFAEVAFHAPDDARFRVGVCRLIAAPRPFERGVHLFDFLR